MANRAFKADDDQVEEVDHFEEERLSQALATLVSQLEVDADKRVSLRSSIEKRWMQDLRQFNSEYEDDILSKLKASGKSQLFINQTRPKTNACDARLSDMLFPADGDNWGIAPTPVPELSTQSKAAVEQARELVDQATAAERGGDPQQGAQLAQQAQGYAKEAQRLNDEMDEARQRSASMADEIRDQLVECDYAGASRKVIEDACQIGTGIMLGPIANKERSRRSWKKRVIDGAEPSAALYDLEMVEDPRPAYYHVDPWGWFPQSDAMTVEESESFFERYINTPQAMRKLARQTGFDKDAIRRVLREGPNKQLPAYLSDLRAIKGDTITDTSNRYVVWCYRGPLSMENMEVLCACKGDDEMAKAAGLDDDGIDPLEELNVVLWFCQGEVLKFGIHHLDSGEGLYSVFNIEKDKASIWGYGIPYIMRNSQKAMNGAWRMMMDNAGLSSGPQIVIDTAVVEPEDGEWSLSARKIWKTKSDAPPGRPGITTYNIESHQADLEAIIALSKQFIDDETNISVLAQGEQGPHTTQTSSGMALLMNAVNVVFRRMVKAFDDDITVPNIRRIYDWNMQFSEKEHIKGDYEVSAKGSAVLLVREVQSQNLMMALQFVDHPVLGKLLKSAALLRKAFQSMLIDADEMVASDDEIREAAQKEAAQPPKPDPEQIKADAAMEQAQIKIDAELQIAQVRKETEMMKLAAAQNMSLEAIRATLEGKQLEAEHTERMKAVDVAVEDRRAKEGKDVGQGVG